MHSSTDLHLSISRVNFTKFKMVIGESNASLQNPLLKGFSTTQPCAVSHSVLCFGPLSYRPGQQGAFGSTFA